MAGHHGPQGLRGDAVLRRFASETGGIPAVAHVGDREPRLEFRLTFG
jgi:hypothetical protein